MPKTIPVSKAKRIADALDMRQVIIIAWDGKLEYVTTFGQSLVDCDQAAQGGDRIKEFLKWEPTGPSYPPRVQKYRDALRKLLSGTAPADDLRDDEIIQVQIRKGYIREALALLDKEPIYDEDHFAVRRHANKTDD